jgi:hypothetical protein
VCVHIPCFTAAIISFPPATAQPIPGAFFIQKLFFSGATALTIKGITSQPDRSQEQINICRSADGPFLYARQNKENP